MDVSGAVVNPKIYLQQLEIERLRKENRAKQEQARLGRSRRPGNRGFWRRRRPGNK